MDCRNCAPVGAATLENCGNGICEPDEGEACDTCAVDCLLPGFPADTCPLTSGVVIQDACAAPPPGIVFDGPPYNEIFSGDCEDGDLCTDNDCAAAAAVCTVTPKACSITDADFCCPAGCNPPPAGADCGPNDSTCDVDCYIPEQCIPTPSPTPPPVFAGCLEGGGGWGEKNGPGCGGAACSLNPAASALPGFGLGLSLAAGFAFAAYRNLRRRAD